MLLYTLGMSLPPGPRSPALLQLGQWVTRPIPLLERCRAEFGDVFTLNLGSLGRITMVSSPMLIKDIFTAPADVLKAGQGNQLLGPLVGPFSLLLLDGAGHLEQRRLLLPPLHGERMTAYCRTMQRIADADFDAWPLDRPLAIQPHSQEVTLDIILKTVFGVEDGAEFTELRALLAGVADQVQTPLVFVPHLQWDLGRWSPWGRLVARLRAIDASIYALIRRRRAESNAGRTDILSLLLAARHEDGDPMSDRELRDELITLLMAGHETTALTLAWAVERVLLHPEVLQRLRVELATVTGGEPLQPEHLPRLEYLDAVIKETLRQRPIIPIVARMVARPFRLGEYDLPVGAIVAPCIALTQSRPDLYPEPDRFSPERFVGQRSDPYGWFPFGGGVRRCVGMAFAVYEMKIVLATWLGRGELELEQPGALQRVRRGISLAPKGGTRVVLRRRREIPRA